MLETESGRKRRKCTEKLGEEDSDFDLLSLICKKSKLLQKSYIAS